MASNNETVAGIIAEVRTINKCADRIEAAHKREIAAKDDERLTIVANYDTVIKDLVRNLSAKDAEIENLKKKIDEYERQPELMAETAREALRTLKEQDAEIAELRECLREAVREKCPFTRMSCKYGEQCDYQCGTERWRKALEGGNNATK